MRVSRAFALVAVITRAHPHFGRDLTNLLVTPTHLSPAHSLGPLLNEVYIYWTDYVCKSALISGLLLATAAHGTKICLRDLVDLKQTYSSADHSDDSKTDGLFPFSRTFLRLVRLKKNQSSI